MQHVKYFDVENCCGSCHVQIMSMFYFVIKLLKGEGLRYQCKQTRMIFAVEAYLGVYKCLQLSH